MANFVAHFEMFASDVERARRFYESVFGWNFEVGGPPDFYLITTGPTSDPGVTNGLVAKRRGPAAPGALNAFRCTISVKSISESIAAIQAAGGTIRGSVVDIPGVGKIVEFADTEDNVVCAAEYIRGSRLVAS